MKNIFHSLILIVFSQTISLAQGIKFQKGTWAEIQAQAKTQNKHIFVDTYFIGCAPCAFMDKNVFPDKEIGDFYNKKFINFKVNTLKGEGKDFAKKYKIQAVPSLLFFSPQGKLVHKIANAALPKAFLQYGKDALNPEKQVYHLKEQFEQGNRQPSFLRNYITALASAYESNHKPLKIYLDLQGKEKWTTSENWQLITKNVRSSASDIFKYIIAHREKFAQALGKEKTNKYLQTVLLRDMRYIARSKDQKKQATFTQQLKNIFGKDAEKHLLKFKYQLALVQNNKDLVMKFASEYFDKHCNNGRELCQAAIILYRKYDNDEVVLKKALTWVERSLAMSEQPAYIDTQASILYKLKRYKKALERAEYLIDWYKKHGSSAPRMQALVKKIKAEM